MGRWIIVLHIVLLGLLAVAKPSWAQSWRTTVKVGQEVDTNPRRIIGEQSETDGGTRGLATLQGQVALSPAWTWGSTVRAGGRLLYATSVEDAAAVEVQTRLTGWSRGATFGGMQASYKDRVERGGFRDYRRVSALPFIGWDGYWIRFTVSGGYSSFWFKPLPRLNWHGPTVVPSLDFFVSNAVTLSLTYRYLLRDVREDRIVEGDEVGTFIVDEDPNGRVDHFHSGSAEVEVIIGRWLGELEYAYQSNNSNSFSRGYRRHMGNLSVTGIPFGRLLLRAVVGIQRTSFSDEVFIDESFAIDDQNQNTYTGTLEHPIGQRGWGVELRFTHFDEAFNSEETQRYSRNLAYAGVSWRQPRRDE